MGIWLGIVFAVLSCAAYTSAAVTQRRLAVRVREPLTSTGELASLLRHPLWWVSLVFNAGRAGFQVAAVSLAPLTVVQPLGVLVLVFGIPWSARLGRRRVSAVEWRGAAFTVVAVGVLLAVTVTEGRGGVLDTSGAVVVSAGTVVLLALTAWTAGRAPSAARRSYLLAGAAGVAFGVSSATVKTAVTVAGDPGATGLVLLTAAATAVIAVAGLFLAQAAYQGMDIGAPLGVTTITNPVAASFVGVAFMGEAYTGGWAGGAVAVACALLAVYGIRLLTVPQNGTPTDAPDPRPAP